MPTLLLIDSLSRTLNLLQGLEWRLGEQVNKLAVVEFQFDLVLLEEVTRTRHNISKEG
jgi:hypothetical protein